MQILTKSHGTFENLRLLLIIKSPFGKKAKAP